MKKIVEVKEGMLGNILAIIFMMVLSGVTLWWTRRYDRISFWISISLCLVWLGACFIFVENLYRPKSAFLAIDGDRIVWSVRTAESSNAIAEGIPLCSLRSLEFVLPRIKNEANSRNHLLAELFFIDQHGNRHRLPSELWPGVHRKQIISMLRSELPDIKVVERVDDGGAI